MNGQGLQPGDRIRIKEGQGAAFSGMRGTVTKHDATPVLVAVWLDGDVIERWFEFDKVAFVERPLRPMIYPTAEVAKELLAIVAQEAGR